MNIFKRCNTNKKLTNSSLWLLSSLPFIYIFSCYIFEKMSENPFEFLMNITGHWAMFFFIVTLAITPLRRWLTFFSVKCKCSYGKRLSDWNFIFYNRRMLGLNSFYYASLHCFLYLYFEIDFDIEEFIYQITSKIHVFIGTISWCLLFFLAITSPFFFQKKLKSYWRKIHRLMYGVALFLPFHLLYEAKIIDGYTIGYFIIISVLLIHRLAVVLVKPLISESNIGMEVERTKALSSPFTEHIKKEDKK